MKEEILLVIESPQLSEHFAGELDRLWRGVELGEHRKGAVEVGATASTMRKWEPAGSGLECGY